MRLFNGFVVLETHASTAFQNLPHERSVPGRGHEESLNVEIKTWPDSWFVGLMVDSAHQ